MNICKENLLDGEPFAQVNCILEEDQDPNEVQTLTFQLNELRMIITTLTRTNEKLIIRIQQLEEQLQEKNRTEQTFQEQSSIMQFDLNDIQGMIQQYRKQLTAYQERINRELKEKNDKINLLKQENEEFKFSFQKLQRKTQELQIQIKILLQTKTNLLNKVYQHQNSIRKRNYESQRYSNRYSEKVDYTNKYEDSQGDFNLHVQRQLQKLIQKLIKQLQHQRYLKKRMTEEVRKLQIDLFKQQRQLMSKNKKNYAMEMTAIKSNKTSYLNIGLKPKNQRYHIKNNGKTKEQEISKSEIKGRGEQSSSSSKSQTFSVMELMSQFIILTLIQKLIIALKIIDFFLKKFQKQHYSIQLLQSIIIWNFSSINPKLSSVRHNNKIQRDHNFNERNYTQAEGIWNLVFVLDNLFNQTETKDYNFGVNQLEESVLDIVMNMLQNKDQNNLRSVLDLKKTIQSAIVDRAP